MLQAKSDKVCIKLISVAIICVLLSSNAVCSAQDISGYHLRAIRANESGHGLDSSNEQIGIAIIGTGRWGGGALRNELTKLSSQRGNMTIYLVAGSRSFDKLAHEHLPENVLLYHRHNEEAVDKGVFSNPDVQAVCIATPFDTHADQVRKALKFGKHVFIEKPICKTAEEAEELIALAKEMGRRLIVGYEFTYERDFLLLKGLLDRGEVGNVSKIELNILNTPKKTASDTSTNVIENLGTHMMSVVQILLGPCQFDDISGVEVIGSDKTARIRFHYKDIAIEINTSSEAAEADKTVIVRGSKATVTLDYGTSIFELVGASGKAIELEDLTKDSEAPSSVQGELRAFIEGLDAEVALPNDAQTLLWILQLTELSNSLLEAAKGSAIGIPEKYYTQATAVAL